MLYVFRPCTDTGVNIWYNSYTVLGKPTSSNRRANLELQLSYSSYLLIHTLGGSWRNSDAWAVTLMGGLKNSTNLLSNLPSFSCLGDLGYKPENRRSPFVCFLSLSLSKNKTNFNIIKNWGCWHFIRVPQQGWVPWLTIWLPASLPGRLLVTGQALGPLPFMW